MKHWVLPLMFTLVILSGCTTDKTMAINTSNQTHYISDKQFSPYLTDNQKAIGKNLYQLFKGRIVSCTFSPNNDLDFTFKAKKVENDSIKQELVSTIRELSKSKEPLGNVKITALSPTSNKPIGKISFYQKDWSKLASVNDDTIISKAQDYWVDINKQ